MNKIYKGQVNQLRQTLINQIKLTFINVDGEDSDIEFNEPFECWQVEESTYDNFPVQVMYIIKGLRVINGQVMLTGETPYFESFDDLELESIWDLYELAFILDVLTEGHYKILSNG